MKRLSLPLLWLIAFAVAVALTVLSAAQLFQPVDYSLHDTYYVVAHSRFSIPLWACLLVFAGLYRWFRLIARVEPRRSLALIHFALVSGGVLLIYTPMCVLTIMGPPRRYVDYPVAFEWSNTITAAGYGLFLVGCAFFFVVVVEAIVRARRTTATR